MSVRFATYKCQRGSGSYFSYKTAAVCAIAFAILSILPARADIYGRISGVIIDPSGAAIPNATVTLTNTDTGVQLATTSLTEGTYAFPAVPIGHYSLEAKRTGFATSRETGIVVDVNTVRIIDFHLTVTSDIQQVTVNAEAPAVVETASTQMGEVVTEKQILDAPLNGRDFTGLMTLQPGVVPQTSSEGSGYSAVSVNGARESGDMFLVNGGSVENGQFMNNAVSPNLDSIAEFRMITSTFDAEYGQFNGAIVNLATKSGTDQFHGSAFDFLRNTIFDGKQYFSGAQQLLIQNQFGGTFGGPILRKKLFFFADYQGTRVVSDASTGQVVVPTDDQRNGNFLPWVQTMEANNGGQNPITNSVPSQHWADELTNLLGYPVTVGERYYTDATDKSGTPCTTANRVCVFPNAQVPTNKINPIATNLLAHVQKPNPGAINSFGFPYFIDNSQRSRFNDNEGAMRGDYNSRLGNMTLYFYNENYSNFNPLSASLPGYPITANGYSTVWNLGLSSTISPTKLNEFRLHAMHNGSFQVPGGAGGGVSYSSTGFDTGSPGNANTPGIIINTPSLDGLPFFSTNEFTTGVSWAEGGNWYTNYQLTDNFSIQAGRHAIKFGGTIYDNQVVNKAIEFTNSTLTFTGGETGSDLMDMEIGALDFFIQGVEDPYHMHAYNFGFFGEDSWRARPDLNINFGLRWDVPKPWAEKNGMITNLNPGQQSVVFPNAPKGFVFPGDPGISNSQAPNRYRTFAPRLGIAYSPAGSPGSTLGRLIGKAGETSIHAGVGVFYTSLEEEMANIDIGCIPFGEFYVNPFPPELKDPFIDRSTGTLHVNAFPAPNVIGASAAHPNPLNFSPYEPISGCPGYWHDNAIPYSYQFNLTIQRQITPRDLFQAGYVGSQGHKLPVNTEANPGNQSLCLSLSQQNEVAPGTNTCGPNGENGVYTAANGTVYNSTRGPFGAAFASDGILRTMGASWYNSLQLSWKHQQKSLTFTLGYTFSKAIDSGSGWSEMLNPINPSVNHALSSFDVPSNFVADYQWELPFARIHRDRFTEGWTISGITHIAQGLPVTFYEADDNSLLGDINSGGGSGADTPVYAPGNLHLGIPHHAVGQPFQYFNPSLFSQDPLGGNGTSKIRFFHGPSTDNTDLALFKDTKIRESLNLEVRFEMFNAFNHTQYGQPNSSWFGATTPYGFGEIFGAGAPRIDQAALKLRF